MEMFCEKCGIKIEENSKFCEACGAPALNTSHINDTIVNKKPKANTNFVKVGQNPAPKLANEKTKINLKKKKLSKRAEIGIFILIFICLVCVNIFIFRNVIFGKDTTASSHKTDSVVNSTESVKSGAKETDNTKKDSDSTNNKDITKKEEDKSKKNNEKKTYTHNYKLIQANMNWEEAKVHCESLGGHLATITSKEEEKKVLDIVNSSDVKVLWLGANDLNSTGDFKWVNGDDFSYYNWAINEPNNEGGVEHYLVLYKVEDNWLWNDGPLNTNEYYKAENIGFVCEWEVEE
jgi:hypothetical protein